MSKIPKDYETGLESYRKGWNHYDGFYSVIQRICISIWIKALDLSMILGFGDRKDAYLAEDIAPSYYDEKYKPLT